MIRLIYHLHVLFLRKIKSDLSFSRILYTQKNQKKGLKKGEWWFRMVSSGKEWWIVVQSGERCGGSQ